MVILKVKRGNLANIFSLFIFFSYYKIIPNASWKKSEFLDFFSILILRKKSFPYFFCILSCHKRLVYILTLCSPHTAYPCLGSCNTTDTLSRLEKSMWTSQLVFILFCFVSLTLQNNNKEETSLIVLFVASRQYI